MLKTNTFQIRKGGSANLKNIVNKRINQRNKPPLTFKNIIKFVEGALSNERSKPELVSVTTRVKNNNDVTAFTQKKNKKPSNVVRIDTPELLIKNNIKETRAKPSRTIIDVKKFVDVSRKKKK